MESEAQASGESPIPKPTDERRARRRKISVVLMIIGMIVEAIGLSSYFLSYLSYFGVQINLSSSGFSLAFLYIGALGIPIFLAGVFLWCLELKTGDPGFDKAVKWSFGIAMVLSFIGVAMGITYYFVIFNNLSTDYSTVSVAIAGGILDQIGILAALIGTFLLIKRAMRNGLGFIVSK